jgi:hypothetical protein
MNRRSELKCTQVNHRDRIALTVGDIGVFAVGGAEITQVARAKVQPAQAADDRKQNYNE